MQLGVSTGMVVTELATYTEMLKLQKGDSKEMLVTYVGCSINSAEAIKTLKIKVSIGTLCRTFFVFSYDYENSSHENKKTLTVRHSWCLGVYMITLKPLEHSLSQSGQAIYSLRPSTLAQ